MPLGRVVEFRLRPSTTVSGNYYCESRTLELTARSLASDILRQALDRLEACECEEGCPSCTRFLPILSYRYKLTLAS